MSDKELNKPMNHEQLNTRRELTSEELDIVTGGASDNQFTNLSPLSNHFFTGSSIHGNGGAGAPGGHGALNANFHTNGVG